MRNTDDNNPLSWLERRIMWRIEQEQEDPTFVGFATGMSDLSKFIGTTPKACRGLVWGLVERGYLGPPQRMERSSRLRFPLLKPLGGQYRLQWSSTGKSELVRAY
jgi:hypothetical protein